MDQLIGCEPGWCEKKTGVLKRHFVNGETAAQMAAEAIQSAMNAAGLKHEDIDAIVCTSGTMEQPLPYTGALIHEALGWQGSGTPAFDINVSCLSFLTGLDIVSYMLEAGRFNRVIVVASDIASVGLDYDNKESAALMGDGAAAVIIERTPEGQTGKVIAARLETYSEGARHSEVPGGGTRFPNARDTDPKKYTFQMDGLKVFRLASQELPDFCERLMSEAELKMEDMNLVIPHQASMISLRLMRTKLGVARDRWMETVREHGNTIAASIPIGLHEAIQQGKIKRGDRVFLLGTSAGLSLGGLILEY